MFTGDRVMTNTDGSKQTVRDFDLKVFYQDLEDCQRLQVSRDEVTWNRTASNAQGHAEISLNLSCGVQGTPHVMMTQVAIFAALGLDFVATAGTKFCCARPLGLMGRTDKADHQAAKSIRRMAAWGSTINVQCCGSCLVEYQHHVGKLKDDAPFEVVHITEFLLETLRRLGDAVPWAPRRRATPRRVLLHAEGAELHVTKEQQRNAVIETLNLIPGVEYAGLVANPTAGVPCASKPRPGAGDSVGHTVLSDLSSKEYRQVQEELFEQALAAGAEAIVTHHHKCHREWSKFGSKRLPVIHYQTLLAEALGVDIPDRFQALWRLGDPAEILEQTRPHWTSWNVTEEEAKRLVTRFFVPAYAAGVQECPCSGDCHTGGAVACGRSEQV